MDLTSKLVKMFPTVPLSIRHETQTHHQTDDKTGCSVLEVSRLPGLIQWQHHPIMSRLGAEVDWLSQ